ncbi:hypothetical protein ACKWTF_015147 [Chironomus riparius]
MRILCCLILLSCSILSLSSSTSLDCSYEYWTFAVIGSIYHCEVQKDPNITTPESAVIDAASGPHHGPKVNNDVAGFYVNNKNMKINFFPLGLEKIYKNLRMIFIHHHGIKELHQSDLKDLTKLKYLSLTDGLIQVIKEGLFDFNLDLLYISFEDNRISQIHPEVFNSLTKLTYLGLNGNRCQFSNANNTTEVVKLIRKIKISCPINDSLTTADESTFEIEDDLTDTKDVKSNAEASEGCMAAPRIDIIVIITTLLHLLTFK